MFDVYSAALDPLKYREAAAHGAELRAEVQVGSTWSCARVGHDGRGVGGREVPAGGDQNGAGGDRVEVVEEGPGEDLAGVVVDDGVEVGRGAVEQLQNGDVDMPILLRSSGANAEGGLLGMHARPRPMPPAVPH